MERPIKSERAVRKRQDPVSCRLCREKKLKCSRLHPCSNCTARGKDCEFDSNQTVTSTRIRQDAEPSNSAILSRLQRLEDMILRMNQNLPNTPESVTASRRLETDQPPPNHLTPDEESHLIESNILTSIGTRQPSLLPAMSYQFVFDTLPLDQLAKYEITMRDQPQPTLGRQRRIILPAYADARMLFEIYVRYVCHFHNVVHIPSFRKILEGLYHALSRKEAVNTDHVALVLAGFSTVMCYIKLSDVDDIYSLEVTPEVAADSETIFLSWFRAALDLLDHSRRVLAGSLEIVQASIILVFLDYNLEGFTSRARAILIQGLQTGKELAMHRLDSPAVVRRREVAPTIDTLIETEMKRRVWWHIISTDWMLSLAGSAQEGTYMAHPHQMRVRLPRNIDDSVLDRGNISEDLPLTHPTPMSYSLQRIRLGEISRSVIDILRIGLSDPTEYDYASLMQLDERLRNFVDDLPVFLKLDPESVQKSEYIVDRYPYFATQRYIINIGAQSVRCKMHQPFLVHSSEHSKFARSAQTCVSAALEVVNINKGVKADQTNYIPKKIKTTGFLHHMFLATVVLVMDLCFNGRNEVDDARNARVLEVVQMLEVAKEESVSVRKFLDSLSEALNKHHIRLIDAPKVSQPKDQPSGSVVPTNVQNWPLTPCSLGVNQVAAGGLQTASQTTTLGFDDVWRGFVDQGDANVMPDWDQLFSELDTYIA